LTPGARGCDHHPITVEYGVIHATVPCSAALFTCRCGASTVEFDLARELPERWSTADDGSPRCPHCAEVGDVLADDR
jgi:hypothetical protein